MTARKKDDYGFLIIENNPIATAGVFGYWGEEIGLPPRATMYQVLRTPEMLNEAAHLFDGKPIVLEHTFIGEERNATPAEQKGIDGALSGARVSNDTLTANLTIYTGRGKRFIEDVTAKRKAEGRDVNLSLGYLAMYEMQSGVWNGRNYDVVQTIVTANHLAILSGNGRAGDAVAMLDGEADRVAAIDFKILNNEVKDVEEDENQAVEDKVDAAQTATIQSLSEKVDALQAMVEAKFAAMQGAPAQSVAETEDEDDPEEYADDEDEDEDKKPMISTEDGAARMSALAIQMTAAHAAAVAVVKPLVQYDWAKLPSAKEVWQYAARKLDLRGDAETAVRTYAMMQSRAAHATADGEATKQASKPPVQTTGTWEAK